MGTSGRDDWQGAVVSWCRQKSRMLQLSRSVPDLCRRPAGTGGPAAEISLDCLDALIGLKQLRQLGAASEAYHLRWHLELIERLVLRSPSPGTLYIATYILFLFVCSFL